MVRFVAVSTSEKVENVFPNWLSDAFTNGEYCPFDLNLPLEIPLRTSEAHAKDSYLTEHGIVLCKLSAHRLAHSHIKPLQIFCGPEFANVQTALALSESFSKLGQSVCVGIEYGLATWQALSSNSTKILWMSPQQLKKLGFEVDDSYKSFVQSSELKDCETHVQFADRLNRVLAEKSAKSRPVVFVADASVILAARGNRWNSAEELCKMRSVIRPCTTHVAIDDSKDAGSLLPMTRTYFHSKEHEEKK